MRPKKTPYILFADDKGNLFEDTSFEVVGRSGQDIVRLAPNDFIELPEGSDFFQLKGRIGLGYDIKRNIFSDCSKGHAVAAFIAPAHTQTYLAAFKNINGTPILPLFAYSAIGWYNDKFYTTALRVDPDIRQDCDQFNQKLVEKNAKIQLKNNTQNRLLKHIAHCATVYLCPAARNYFLNRWEAPLPTSPSCNSRCMGCISYQPKEHGISSTQFRINFIPTPEEIAEIAIEHLETAPLPIVSFGQGCEGEPLLVWETLKKAIILIRNKTKKGVINLNTNGSLPDAVDELCSVGLDSIRVSMNSAQKHLYNSYYKPVNYSFDDIVKSIFYARKKNKWVSVNYFVFPGVTDSQEEYSELKNLIKNTRINMIQWRNFNIDPEWYLNEINWPKNVAVIGVPNMINKLKQEFSGLYHGYFNPSQILIAENISKM